MKKMLGVIGGGESGVGAALLANLNEWEVFLSDFGELSQSHKEELQNNNIRFEEGGHSFDILKDALLVVKSPGVRDDVTIIKKLKSEGIKIVSEIDFGFLYNESKIVSVTGSNGKTTTTGLIYHILNSAGKDVRIGGNYGNSYCRLLTGPKPEIFVLELSSFQLDGIHSFRSDISVLLNITADHLDRYEYDIEKYKASKFRIIENQLDSDLFIYNAKDPMIAKHIDSIDVVPNKIPIDERIENNLLHIGKKMFFDLSLCSLKGRHNQSNIACAAMVAHSLGISQDQIQSALNDFQNLPHRMELVEKVKGVDIINDSKATNVDSSWFALDSIKGNIIWIAGGTDKGNDYSNLIDLASKKVKALICLGVDNKKLRESFKLIIDEIEETQDVFKAVEMAISHAENGDTIILSPACASFDLFKNYEHRGDMFKDAVRQYIEENNLKD